MEPEWPQVRTGVCAWGVREHLPMKQILHQAAVAEHLFLPLVLYCIDSSSQTAEEDTITVMTCGDTEVGKARILPVPGRRKTCAGWGDGEERGGESREGGSSTERRCPRHRV